MPTFTLGECSIALSIEPLAEPLAREDRQLAWELYLALATRPALRADALPPDALGELVDSLRGMLSRWPAGEIENPRAGHLGFLLVAIIELVFVPCLVRGAQSSDAIRPVLDFCQSMAREVARVYGFPDPGANVPGDLAQAWRNCA